MSIHGRTCTCRTKAISWFQQQSTQLRCTIHMHMYSYTCHAAHVHMTMVHVHVLMKFQGCTYAKSLNTYPSIVVASSSNFLKTSIAMVWSGSRDTPDLSFWCVDLQASYGLTTSDSSLVYMQVEKVTVTMQQQLEGQHRTLQTPSTSSQCNH